MRAGIMVGKEYRSISFPSLRNGDFHDLVLHLTEYAKISSDGSASFTAENGVFHTVWVDQECVREGMEAEIRPSVD